MKKSLLFTLFLIFLSFSQILHADPWDGMSRSQAEKLVEYLHLNPYLVDYCDPCDDLEAQFEGSRLPAFLVRVSNPRVVPCHWDEELWSVQVDFKTIAWGYTNQARAISPVQSPETMPEGTGPSPVFLDDDRYCITLNYHWTLVGGEATRLCFPVEYEHSMGNHGLSEFPAKEDVADKAERKAYAKWLKSVR